MASKSKRRRRVLGASCILAALIIAGSSFAWFTSKDEVTNRLSASANYGVTIAEDFTPPENWLPGQEINKDVGVVNTGNVDAFTRVWLEGEMNIVKQKATSTKTFVSTYEAFDTSDLNDVTDPKLVAAGLKKVSTDSSGATTYYKLLSTTERTNSAINGTNTNVNDNDYSEVKAVQAGGWLAYASTGAAFTFSPEQEYKYVDTSDNVVVAAAETTINSSSIKNTWTGGVGLAIDSDTFTPTAAGLYIFRRDVNEGSTAGQYLYEYSGYFFDGTNYYALKNQTTVTNANTYSDYTIDTSKLTITYDETGTAAFPVKSVVPNGVELYEASKINLKNTVLAWKYTAPDATNSKQGKLTASYGTGAEKIEVDVALSNIYGATEIAGKDYISNDTSESWTVLGATSDNTADDVTATFYYNNDVEEGDTTKKLVDNVTLSSDTKKEAYIAFDFDLNVKMDSVQVTVDDTGNETVTAAQASFTSGAPKNISGTNGVTNGNSANEAGALTWTPAP